MKNNTKISILLCAITALTDLSHLAAMDESQDMWINVEGHNIYVPKDALRQMNMNDLRDILKENTQGGKAPWAINEGGIHFEIKAKLFQILVDWLTLLSRNEQKLKHILRGAPNNLIAQPILGMGSPIFEYAELLGANRLMDLIANEENKREKGEQHEYHSKTGSKYEK